MAGKIEIVTHCWAGEFPQYAAMLRYQLAAVEEAVAEGVPVVVSVCCASRVFDGQTAHVLDDFRSQMVRGKRWVRVFELEPGRLFRRAIGRNVVAKQSDAGLIWFADVDYVPTVQALRVLSERVAVNPEQRLGFLPRISICIDHAAGDRIWQEALRKNPIDGPVPDGFRWEHTRPTIPWGHFRERKEKKAIGGNMFVGGDHARAGYLDGEQRWQEPVDPASGFQQCKCDPAYRRWLGQGKGAPLDVGEPCPIVYRIRHTQNHLTPKAERAKR